MEGGGDLPVRRRSYTGHRVELWGASDWLKNGKKQLNVQQSRPNSDVPGLYPALAMRFRPLEGLVGCVFLLYCTGWFRLNAKNCVRGNSSRRFFELDHEILHTYSGRQYLKLEEGGFLIWGFAVEISGF